MSSKRALRMEMRQRRNTFDNRDALDGEIRKHLLNSALYKDADHILCYASYGSEADTYGILQDALQQRKSVYLPYCVSGTNHLVFYRIDSLSALQTDAFGIPAPQPNPEKQYTGAASALCIVPGLAFSLTGERLGYGRGYYDTFLEGTDIPTVGLCYSFQIVPMVPTEPHDFRMQYLCTDKGVHAVYNSCLHPDERKDI